jgi:hypothetical protein
MERTGSRLRLGRDNHHLEGVLPLAKVQSQWLQPRLPLERQRSKVSAPRETVRRCPRQSPISQPLREG